MNLPKHLAICIEHNPHKCYYETVEQHFADRPQKWVSEEDRQLCVANDDVWTVQYYPDTPIGFYCAAGSSLEIVLDYLNKE